MIATLGMALLGFVVSIYAYSVEEKLKKDATYKPFCDISDSISCSNVVTSAYSNIFYLSNAIVGMGYYTVVALFAVFKYQQLLIFATVGGCVVSAIFAYILYAKIRSLCLICVSLYGVNVGLLVSVLYSIPQ